MGVVNDHVEEQMADKPATNACQFCKGKGTITCPQCHGQGRQSSTNAAARPCQSCHGKGNSVCPECRGAKKAQSGK